LGLKNKQQTRTATKKATRGQQKQNNCDDGLVTKKQKRKIIKKIVCLHSPLHINKIATI
jgi:hypothetical protein